MSLCVTAQFALVLLGHTFPYVGITQHVQVKHAFGQESDETGDKYICKMENLILISGNLYTKCNPNLWRSSLHTTQQGLSGDWRRMLIIDEFS